MKVELTNEAVDGLIKSILLQDYQGLSSDIERLKSLGNKGRAQSTDLENNYKYQAAMETVLEYYVGVHWKDEL